MERGAVLLLDEIDLASSKIMCLQPVLEGNGVFLKKVNRFVSPSKGFTVLATANTKGKGSEDGRFIGTNILNEAFLERFPITVEQEYPAMSVERKILDKVFASLDVELVISLKGWSLPTLFVRPSMKAGLMRSSPHGVWSTSSTHFPSLVIERRPLSCVSLVLMRIPKPLSLTFTQRLMSRSQTRLKMS